MSSPASIPDLLARAAAERGDAPAVVDDEVELGWRGLHARAGHFASQLVPSIAPGDRVALWAPNSRFWIEAVFGIWMAGGVLVPINTRFKGPEAAVLLQRSRAKVLVATRTFLDTDYVAMLEAVGADLPDLAAVLTREEHWDPIHSTVRDDALAEVERRSAALGIDDRSDVLFTSGTTGVPKGVVMTHGRTLRVASDWVAMTGLSAGDRYLMVNPYFHMFGLKAGILASTVAGAAMYPEPVFDAGRVLERVAAERITVLPGAPTVYQSLLDHPDRGAHDLSSLRVAVTGAADIPVQLIERVREELPFEVVVTGYGLSEAGTASATVPEDDPETVATTVGRARPGFEIRIEDNGAEQPRGEAGEVVLRGPSVMAEYLDDPEATRAALSPDGWLRTGDLGVLDERGNLRIVGRIKDLFIVGGFNAYPAEIEGALLRHPSVQQVAVIGIPDARLGEVGMAFVVPAADVDPSTLAEDVIAWARDQMANYKVPRRIELVDALPVNATGKVVKDDLRARVTPTP
jgi:acyl-CoA synthetase (AMP-forming)/AMP-acid ligase II